MVTFNSSKFKIEDIGPEAMPEGFDSKNDKIFNEDIPMPKVKGIRGGSLKTPLLKTYSAIGQTVFAFDQECGAAILQSAESCAESLDILARQNEAVRKALEALTKTTVFGAVIAAHLPIAMAVIAHHNPEAITRITGIFVRSQAAQI